MSAAVVVVIFKNLKPYFFVFCFSNFSVLKSTINQYLTSVFSGSHAQHCSYRLSLTGSMRIKTNT